jgi:hypothetical protein
VKSRILIPATNDAIKGASTRRRIAESQAEEKAAAATAPKAGE